MLEGPREQAQERGARARDSSPPAPPTPTDSEDTPSPGAPADRQRRPLSGAPTPGELLAAPALQCKGKMPADPELAAPAVASSGTPELTGPALSTPGQRSARAHPAGSGPAKRLVIREGPAEAAGSGGPGCASRGEGSVDLGTGERAGGVGNEYLQGRERALGEAVGEATRSAAALDHITARKLSARKRARHDEAAGGAGCSGSRVQAGTSMAEEEGGMQGAVRVDELLEMIAQAGDQRLLQEARERASAGAAAAAATAGDPGTAAGLAGLESNGMAGAHAAESAGTGAHVLQIRGWRRSLVRALPAQARASGAAAASRDREPRAAAVDDGRADTAQADGGFELRASGGTADTHTGAGTAGAPSTPDGRGRSANNASASRLAWRVDVSAECSGLGFSLAFLVSQDSEELDLLSLDLPPAAQLALAPVLRGGADARGGLDVQEVVRTVAVYGAVAARRREVLEEAAGRHSHSGNASMSHTRAPHDYARVRFRGDGPRGSGAAVDVEWDVVVGTDGIVSDDVNIQVWAPEGLSQGEAAELVDKMKRLWEAVCVLKGPASALSVLVALL